jgi:hypothetical protein
MGSGADQPQRLRPGGDGGDSVHGCLQGKGGPRGTMASGEPHRHRGTFVPNNIGVLHPLPSQAMVRDDGGRAGMALGFSQGSNEGPQGRHRQSSKDGGGDATAHAGGGRLGRGDDGIQRSAHRRRKHHHGDRRRIAGRGGNGGGHQVSGGQEDRQRERGSRRILIFCMHVCAVVALMFTTCDI